jgi:hypothetical protein
MMLDLPRAIARLASNAEAFAALLAAVSDEQARWKPSAGKWSLLEVINHLADEEREDFRARLRSVLETPGAPWGKIDPEGWVVARGYATRSLDASLADFRTERQRSLNWLRTLRTPDWHAAYEHPTAGPIRAGDLLVSWQAHDLIHIRQMNRLHLEYLLTGAGDYSPEYAGPW